MSVFLPFHCDVASASVSAVSVAVPVAIVLGLLLAIAAVICGVIIVLRSRHRSDRKIGVCDVILCEWSTYVYNYTMCIQY